MNISEEEVKKIPVKRHKMDSESEEDKSPLGKIKPTFQELEDEKSISQRGLPEHGKIKDDNLMFIEVQEDILYKDTMPNLKTNILVTNISSSLVDL